MFSIFNKKQFDKSRFIALFWKNIKKQKQQ